MILRIIGILFLSALGIFVVSTYVIGVQWILDNSKTFWGKTASISLLSFFYLAIALFILSQGEETRKREEKKNNKVES